ncbi:hypothetical protein EDD15DRAFT_561844 [Pisolithus albus]|nr:hypothetical protein EDD15DRAFT_561844 [Pisolithus albus]
MFTACSTHTSNTKMTVGSMQRCKVLCRTPRDARAVITDVESSSSRSFQGFVSAMKLCTLSTNGRIAAGDCRPTQRWLAGRILLTHVIVRQSLFFFFSGHDSTVCISVLLSRGLAVCADHRARWPSSNASTRICQSASASCYNNQSHRSRILG